VEPLTVLAASVGAAVQTAVNGFIDAVFNRKKLTKHLFGI
jgi:hypothetical protein